MFSLGTVVLPFKSVVKPPHRSTVRQSQQACLRDILKQNAKYFRNSTTGMYVFNMIVLILREY